MSQHLFASLRHNICQLCIPSIDLPTSESLEDHQSSCHDSRGITDRLTLLPQDSYGYSGIPTDLVKPVFEVACRLRSSKPGADAVIAISRSILPVDVIKAIIKAALRVLPIDSSPEGRCLRLEAERLSRARAADAEDAFIQGISRSGIRYFTENDQKRSMMAEIESEKRTHFGPTPDVLLATPILISGNMCHWIEYKNDFGFRKSPFVTSSSRKQFQKYVDNIGPGLVVYKLGFEQGFLNMPGVKFLREAEAISELRKHHA